MSQATVDLSSYNNSPVLSVTPIVNLQVNSTATYQIPSSDPDGDAVSFRLATLSESDGNNVSAVSVSSTGLVTFNTNSTTIGQLYNVIVAAEDGSSKVMADFIVRIVKQSNPPIWNYSVTPSNNYNYQVSPGQTVSFNLKASDIDAPGTVGISAVGVPSGATFSATSGAPATGSFSWTPTTADLGTTVINFTATDLDNSQTSTGVSITVSQKPQFDVPPTPDNTYFQVAQPGDVVTFDVQAHVADVTDNATIYKVESQEPGGSMGPLLSGASFSVPTTAAVTTSGTFSWTTTSSQWGMYDLKFYAQNTHGDINTYTLTYLLNTTPVFTSTPNTTAFVGQPWSYTVVGYDPDVALGDHLAMIGCPMPSWMTFTDNGDGTATFSGTPGVGDDGDVFLYSSIEDDYHHSNIGGIPTQHFTLNVSPCNIQVSETHNDEGCTGSMGGSIDLTITGANNGTFVSWTGPNSFVSSAEDLSGLSAGTYTASIYDGNGCSSSIEVTITSLPLPVVTMDNFGSVCPKAHITLSGGMPAGGTYSGDGVSNGEFDAWTAGIGTHTITYQYTNSNGCTNSTTASITVEDNENPVAAAKNITITLDGTTGSASISPSDVDNGSTDNCSFDLSLDNSSFSCSDVGDNTVTLTATDAAGNTNSTTCVVTVKTTLDATATTTASTVYYGYSSMASATLKAIPTGGSGSYTYLWSTGATTQSVTVSPTSSTTYDVTVTDGNGCSVETSVSVDVLDVRCGKKLDKVAVCHNGNTICIDASAVSTHLSSHSDGLGECSSKNASYTELDNNVTLQAYPNPFAQTTNLSFSVTKDGQASLEVYDMRGVKIATLYNGNAVTGDVYKVKFDASGLSSNIYLARLITAEGTKIIKIDLLK
jgi:hypothetical protein